MSEHRARILLADDEKNVRKSMKLVLEDAGYEVLLAENAFQVIRLSQAHQVDLLVLDVRMGEVTGIQALEKLRQSGVSSPALFISGHATLSEAVQAIRSGAADFLEKPFTDEKFLISVERALRIGDLERKLRQSEALLGPRSEDLGILGSSPQIRAVRETIRKIAPTRAKVLITGESGTGKELIARAVHQLSPVGSGPFIKVNCASIPADLIESELFGHERGAFTGAHQLKRGLFELAHRGSIFLDEIGEMSLDAQAKVLRVLQSNELQRVGGASPIRVDVRVIAATHRDLLEAVRIGRFREDLYFRINVVPVHSPALRERLEDLPLLLAAFVREFCAENGFTEKSLAPKVLAALEGYSWPGNVRELRNLAERLVILSGDRIDLRDLPAHLQGASRAEPAVGHVTLREFKAAAERAHIIETLRRTQGSVSQAARLLDIERTYLHRRIQELLIEKKEYF